MAFNGSGTYVLPGSALVNGQTVNADEHNTFRNDVATALTDCITRDGQSPATANIPMGGFKITGLAAATGNGEAVRFEQLPAPLTTASTVALGTANITSLNVSQVAALSTAQISALSVGSITGVLKATSGAVSEAIAGTDYLAAVAPGTSGNVLTSNGSAWTSSTPTVGFRNKIFNGDMRIDQRNGGGAQTITAGSALAYSVDRFYAYCTGANVTGQQVAGSIANTKRYKFTGAASVTGIGFGTRLEATNTAFLASSTVTLQAKLSSSSLTSIGWAAYYASTTDSFGTLASPTRTSIASGTFTINSTEATYSANISLPSGATTGIEIVFTGGALLAAQTLTIGDIQLEYGSSATAFENRPYGTELALCQRYFQAFTKPPLRGVSSGANTAQRVGMSLPVRMRTSPSISLSGSFDWYDGSGTGQVTTATGTNSTPGSVEVDFSGVITTAQFRPFIIIASTNTGTISLSSEL